MNDKTKHSEKRQTCIPSGLLTVICAAIACLLIGIEFFRHFSFNNNVPIENWVTTATFFNNAFSPILLFTSVLLLYRTWKDSKTALELQRVELKETKKILEMQVDLQNFPIVQQSILILVDDLNTYLNQEVTLCIDNGSFTITKSEPREDSMDERLCINSLIINHYTRSALDNNDNETDSFKGLLKNNNLSFPDTELNALSFLLISISNSEKKEFMEIVLFSKFDLRVWLFFSYRLFLLKGKEPIYSSSGYDYDEMFNVIATLTYKRLKKSSWLLKLPPDFLDELKRKEIK